MDLEQRVNALEDRVSELDHQINDLDTQLNAAEQALAALKISKKTKQDVEVLKMDVDEKLALVNRALYKADKVIQALACSGVGGVLLWLANPIVHDANEPNDYIGYFLFASGVAFLAYGLLVLTENEKIVLSWLEKINPFSK